MPSDLQSALPELVPKAIAWAEAEASTIARIGRRLDQPLSKLARRVGVAHPELIHIAEFHQLPLPDDPQLQQAALATGLLGPDTGGLTLGYGIYVRQGWSGDRLFSHEFRHVYQYEQAGSIAAFLPLYLQQIVCYGYADAPYEIDARNHEIDHP